MAEDLQKTFNELFTEFRVELYQDLIDSLERKGVVGSKGTASSLAGSIEFKAISKQGVLGFNMEINDYWEFVENGRKPTNWRFKKGRGGKSAFIESIKNWIEWKGLTPKTIKGQSKDKAYTSFAFAIANAINKKGTIKRFGYKGSKFLSDVLNDGRVDVFASELQELLGDEVVFIVTNKF